MPSDASISRALGFLIAAGSSGFRDAWEIQAGFRGAPLLIGTVFPLSFIALALARPELNSSVAVELARREVETIVALGDDTGWRYFNLFPQIPPDADDLAHVIHVLTLTDWEDRDTILAGPLAMLDSNFHPDGSCNTWLVTDALAAENARLSWAGGDDLCHPEVLANLLDALATYDPERYAAQLEKGARWLIQRRSPEGWAGYWYWGWGYGTFQVVRALRKVTDLLPHLAPETRPAIQAALASMIERQALEGSWAPLRAPVEQAPDEAMRAAAQETAFCIEALAAGRDWTPPEGQLALQRAAAWLVTQQANDGGWAAEPLYFTLGRSAYQSREVATAIILGALLTARMTIQAASRV